MTGSVSLMPIRPSEIVVGMPLPWPVYDWHGNLLLLSSGVVIENQRQLDGLLENGFVHDSRWDANLNQLEAAKETAEEKSAGGRRRRQ